VERLTLRCYWKNTQKRFETHFFEIDVSMTKGTPSRDPEGRAGFTFDGTGGQTG
jgi:hypothetical protein